MDDKIKTTGLFQGNIPLPQSPVSVPGGKEVEHTSIDNSFELPIHDMGKEMEMPKEITGAGVKQQPVAVPVPPPLVNVGVKPAGPNVSMGNGDTVTLPLTQPQVVEGLQKSITESWRWLAEWCIRRLKLFSQK